MAKEKGTNVLMYVGDDPLTTFTLVAGQKSGEWTGNRPTLDTSDKDTSGWATAIGGLKNGSANVSGQSKWPDTSGIKAVEAIWESDSGIGNFYVRFNSNGDGFQGKFSVTDFNISGADDGITEYSFTITAAEALTKTTSVPGEVT